MVSFLHITWHRTATTSPEWKLSSRWVSSRMTYAVWMRTVLTIAARSVTSFPMRPVPRHRNWRNLCDWFAYALRSVALSRDRNA
ncbi:hypothetical protein RGAI101_29 [Roseobacter sp. GAI101]|nr:hypothetical protein RGAI101_29 [Roseobacter sp. GAI101]